MSKSYQMTFRDYLLTFVVLVAVTISSFLGIAKTVWAMNNPKANWTTFWTEMPEPLNFGKMEKYQ